MPRGRVSFRCYSWEIVNIRWILVLLAAVPLLGDEAWVELGPAPSGFAAIARYASRDVKTCPTITLNGRSSPMAKRTNTGKFSALVCQAAIPSGTRTAKINGQALPLPAWTGKADPKIVVIGDTGCRIKQGGEDSTAPGGKWNIQNCASPKDWPFEEVAEHAAAEKPDLVIHVGDYVYREKPCDGVKGCPGGPSGDTLETWEADFFTPARKLLLAAPWVFVRGNHEDCSRSGDGWFTLLDPRSIAVCTSYSQPYLLKTKIGLPLVVLDSNPALDAPCKEGDAACSVEFGKQTEIYTKAFETISTWKLPHAWLVTHKPVWSVKGGPDGVQVLNAVEETAWKLHRPQGIDLLLAGHTHTFEMIGFDAKSNHAMQLVVGNSGTKLVPPLTYDGAAPAVVEAQIKNFRNIQDFGYTTLTPAQTGWNVLAHRRDGKVDIACEVEAGKPRCQKEQ
jgi:predicted phosphodiesterase